MLFLSRFEGEYRGPVDIQMTGAFRSSGIVTERTEVAVQDSEGYSYRLSS